jgi:hypothetical protein
MDRDAGDELHLEVAREMLGLGLVDLLDTHHVGIDLPQDVRDAVETHLAIEPSGPMDVVGCHADHLRRGGARAAVRPFRSCHDLGSRV